MVVFRQASAFDAECLAVLGEGQLEPLGRLRSRVAGGLRNDRRCCGLILRIRVVGHPGVSVGRLVF